MRAITASGMVPRATIGRMRCERAERKAPWSSDQQRIDEQEAGHRLDVVLDRDASRDRGPAERVGEEDDEEEAPPEDRHRIAGERDPHDAVVEHRVALDRGDDPGRQPEEYRKEHGRERELDGRGEELRELGDHRRVGDEREPEVAAQHVAHVDEVLDVERAVEAVVVEELCVARGRDPALAREDLERVARHRVHEEKREQRDPDEGRDDEDQAREDETQHQMAMRTPGSLRARIIPSPACGRGRGPRPQGRGRVRDGAGIRQSLTLPIPSGWAPSLSRKRERGFSRASVVRSYVHPVARARRGRGRDVTPP